MILFVGTVGLQELSRLLRWIGSLSSIRVFHLFSSILLYSLR